MMLQNLDYNSRMSILNTIDMNGNFLRLTLEKSYFRQLQKDQYFIKAYTIIDGNLICLGYIYFYIDFDTMTSEYIGSLIKDEHRNNGLASLLHACWIDLCLQNGLEHLQTIKNQRKPFLIYLLKKNAFEIEDPSLYDRLSYTIHICKKDDDPSKYLLFKSPKAAEHFKRGTIYAHDNYQILDSLDRDTQILDSVLLSHRYYAFDNEETYQNAEMTLSRYKK